MEKQKKEHDDTTKKEKTKKVKKGGFKFPTKTPKSEVVVKNEEIAPEFKSVEDSVDHEEKKIARMYVLNGGDARSTYIDVYKPEAPNKAIIKIPDAFVEILTRPNVVAYINMLARSFPTEAIARFELIKGLQAPVPKKTMGWGEKSKYIDTALTIDDGPLAKKDKSGGDTNIAMVFK